MMNTKLFCICLLYFFISAPIKVLSQSNVVQDTFLLEKAEAVIKQSQAELIKTKKNISKFISRSERRRQKLESKFFSKHWSAIDSSAFGNQAISMLAQQIQHGTAIDAKGSLMYLKRLDTLKMLTSFFSTSDKLPLPAEEVQSLLAKFSDYNNVITSRLSALNSFQSTYAKLGKRELNAVRKLRENVLRSRMKIEDIKLTLDNPAKLENELLIALSQSKKWKDFAAKNSELSRFFATSGRTSTIEIKNLQTNEDVVRNLNSKFGEYGAEVANISNGYPAMVKKQLTSGQPAPVYSSFASVLLPSLPSETSFGNELIAKNQELEKAGSKNRSFWKRLEVGWNFQTRGQVNSAGERAHALGLSLGYKVSGSLILGIGSAHEITSQLPKSLSFSTVGTSFRAFLDGKFARSWWISTAYETINISGVNGASVQSRYNEPSFLLGLTRKVNIGEKSSKLQLFIDLNRVKNGQTISDALLLRIGRNF